MSHRRTDRGFTFIELMVVISIISMLSSVVLASVASARSKARDGARIGQSHQIDTAVQLYMADHDGKAPALNNTCSAEYITDRQSGNLSGGSSVNQDVQSACVAVSTDMQSSAWTNFKKDLQPYMPNVPGDPCPSCTTDLGGTPGYTYFSPASIKYSDQCAPSSCIMSDTQYNQSYSFNLSLEKTSALSPTLPAPILVFTLTQTSAVSVANPNNQLAMVWIPPDYRGYYTIVLTWSSSGATSCRASNAWTGNLPLSGSRTITTNQSGVYTINCYGQSGSAVSRTSYFNIQTQTIYNSLPQY